MKKHELEAKVKELTRLLADARQVTMTEISNAYDQDDFDLFMERRLGFRADQDFCTFDRGEPQRCVLCGTKTRQKRTTGDLPVCGLCTDTPNGPLTVGRFWELYEKIHST